MSFFLRLDIEILHFEHVSLTLREGKPAWFEVNVKSNTSCNVKWFHDGNLITTSSTRFTMTSVRKENGTSSHTLHTASVLPRDGGKLQETFGCTAQFLFHSCLLKYSNVYWVLLGEWKIIASNQEIYATRNLTVTGKS